MAIVAFTPAEAQLELEDLPKPKPTTALGEDLSTISVDELQKRIQALEAEINRVKAEIGRKQSSRLAADSFFKT